MPLPERHFMIRYFKLSRLLSHPDKMVHRATSTETRLLTRDGDKGTGGGGEEGGRGRDGDKGTGGGGRKGGRGRRKSGAKEWWLNRGYRPAKKTGETEDRRQN